MVHYALLTRWVGTGKESDPYIMEVARHYPQAAVGDLVGHPRVPPSPNVALAAVECAAPAAALLRDDPRYDGLILWQGTTAAETLATFPQVQKRPGAFLPRGGTDLPSDQDGLERTASVDAAAAEKIRAGLERLGLTTAQAGALVGAAEGMTRAELCEALNARARLFASAR